MNTIAHTIRRQIGTDAWLAVSARDAYRTPDSLVFRYGVRGGAVRKITVTLTPDDVYLVTAHRIPMRGKNFGIPAQTAQYEGVYAEQLAGVIRAINNEG